MNSATTRTNQRILTRPFVLAVSAQHLYFAAFYSTLTAMPLYLSDLPAWQPGVIIGVMGISSLIFGPLAGLFADRIGRRKTAVFGAATTAVVFAVQGLSQAFWFLVVVRLIHGCVMQFFATANSTQTADLAPAARRGEAMGFASTSNTAAQIYAPWLGLFIAVTFGFATYWAVTFALVAGSTALSLVVPDNYVWSGAKSKLIARSAIMPFIVFTGFATGFGVLTAFLTPWGQFGLGDAGVWFVIFGLAMLTVRVNAGRLADRIGRVKVIVPAGFVCCAGFFVLSVPQTWAFYASAIPIGLGFAAAHTSLTALTIDRAGPTERGAAMGVFFLAWGAGQIIGAIGFSPLATDQTYGAVFIAGGVFAVLGLPFLFLGNRARRPAEVPASIAPANAMAPAVVEPVPRARPALFAAASVGAWLVLMLYLTWMSWVRGVRRPDAPQ